MGKIYHTGFALLLGISSVAYATTDSPFNGFYGGIEAGGNVGYFSEQGNATLTLNQPFIQYSFQAPYDTHVSNLAIFTGGQAGFGHVFNRFYLGIEANGDLGSLDTTDYPALTDSTSDLNANVKNTVTLKNNYGVTLRPGYLITPTTLIYAQAGVQWAQINFDSTSNFGNIPTLPGQAYTSSASTNETQMGYRIGLGLEKMATKHLSLRVEYTFTGFQSMDVSNQTTITGSSILAGSNISQSASLSPYMHSIMLGVNYYV